MLRYRLLGPLTVERDGVELDLGTPKQRAVLAVLAQEAGSTVSTDRILDSVWGDRQPGSVQSSLQANISRLRRVLRPDPSAPPPIVLRSGGYRLDLDPAAIDVTQFIDLSSHARTALQEQDWSAAVEAAQIALDLWRGTYLEDFRDEEWVRIAAAPLAERRSGVLQDLIVGLLGIGDISSALARSTAASLEQPLVERVAWLHMIALNRAGRTADALETFRVMTGRLDVELGLDPGPALRDLQAAILRQEPEPLFWPRSAPLSAPSTRHVPGIVEPPASPTPSAPDGSGDPSVAVHSIPFVGRADELARIRSALEQARNAGAQWTVLTGPAGIGKTRLAEEVSSQWRSGGRSVIRGQCPDLDDVPAWWPIRQLLRDLDVDPDEVLAPVAGGEVDSARFAVFDKVLDAIRCRLEQQPLLIVVDDIHWADRASLTLLTLLAESVTTPRLSVILTSRPMQGRPEFDRLLASVARRPGSIQLALTPFDAGDVAQLVQEVTGERPDAAAAADLAERTGGTPFYVVEYARLPPALRHGETIPVAVRTVLRRRLSGLPPDVLEIARIAAVLGDPLDVHLLSRISRRDTATIGDLLDAAADLDVLTPSLDGTAYVFTHALLRAELAAEVADTRHRRLHLEAAQLLANATGFNGVQQRARHLLAAGPLADPEQAYQAFCAAASAADDQWLSDPAATWWKAALDTFDRLTNRDPREKDGLVAAQVRAMAWSGRGQAVLDALDAALIDTLRAHRTESVGRLAASLLRVSGSWPWPVYGSDPAPLMVTLRGLDASLQTDTAARARVLAVRAIGECYHPDPGVPEQLSRLAIELAEETGDSDVLADALLGRALTYAGVATHSVESVAVLERLSRLDRESAPGDEVLRHNLLTMATMNLARTKECADHVHAGAVGADVLRLPVNRVQLRWAEASLAQWSGDLPRARELYERAELAHRRTDLQQSGTFELAHLVLLWDEGRLAEFSGTVPTNPMMSMWTTVAADAAAGRPGCDNALAVEVQRHEPDVWTSHGRATLLAHCVADRGLTQLAVPLLDLLEPVRDQLASFGQVGTIGPVALAMARLSHLLDDHVAARAHLARAIDIARGSGGAGALLHCRLQAAIWHAACPGGSPSPELRRTVVDIAREADERGMSGVAQRARELY